MSEEKKEKIAYKLDWGIKDAEKAIQKIKESVNEQSEVLATLTSEGQVEKLIPCPMITTYYYVKNYKTPGGTRQQIEAIYKKAKSIYKQNLETIEKNKKIEQAIFAIMKKFNIPEKNYTYKSRRSKKQEWSLCEWTKEVRNFIPTIQQDPKIIFEQKMKEIEKWEKEIITEKGEKEREEQIKENEKKKQNIIAYIALKYNCKPDANAEEVFQTILKKDKYIALALGLERNHGDWSDNYSYAKDALVEFSVENKDDTAIVKDISLCIQEWDGDGRIFRDTLWNYDRIYTLANEEVLQDFRKMQEIMPLI